MPINLLKYTEEKVHNSFDFWITARDVNFNELTLVSVFASTSLYSESDRLFMH